MKNSVDGVPTLIKKDMFNQEPLEKEKKQENESKRFTTSIG